MTNGIGGTRGILSHKHGLAAGTRLALTKGGRSGAADRIVRRQEAQQRRVDLVRALLLGAQEFPNALRNA
jgi:hypothetical protein